MTMPDLLVIVTQCTQHIRIDYSGYRGAIAAISQNRQKNVLADLHWFLPIVTNLLVSAFAQWFPNWQEI